MNKQRLGTMLGASILALSMSSAFAADMIDNKAANDTTGTQAQQPMTGKQKATAIGATTGAVAGAVVGGPVGAVVGAGVGGYVGHQGTDANGKVDTTSAPDARAAGTAGSNGSAMHGSDAVRSAQTALNTRGYSAGTADGVMGPNTQNALRRFQADQGIAQSGSLDDATRQALGVN